MSMLLCIVSELMGVLSPQFVNGQAKLDLGVDEVYTLTTLSTGQKGAHPKPPAPMKFPQVIADDFSCNYLLRYI